MTKAAAAESIERLYKAGRKGTLYHGLEHGHVHALVQGLHTHGTVLPGQAAGRGACLRARGGGGRRLCQARRLIWLTCGSRHEL